MAPVPPHRPAAPPRRRHRLRTALALLLATVAVAAGTSVLPRPAHADGMPSDPAALRLLLFSGYLRAHDAGNQGLLDLVSSAYLGGYRQSHPDASADDLTRYLAELQNSLKGQMKASDWQRPTYDVLINLLDMASKLPKYGVPAGIGEDLIKKLIGSQVTSWGHLQDELTAATQSYTWLQNFYTTQDSTWGALATMGATDPSLKVAWDGVIGSRLNVSLSSTTEQLMADPLIGTWLNVQALVDDINHQTTYMEEARADFAKWQAGLNQKIADLIKTMQAAATPLNQPSPNVQQLVADTAARQQVIDGASAAVYILSTIIGFSDKAAGRQVAAVGNAAVSIATAINKYIPTVAGLGIGQAIGALSTVALTGNILGAVMTLLPIFMGAPSTDDLINNVLQEVQTLSQDVHQMWQNMTSRFDRIEEGLVKIYGDMLTQFDRLSGAVADVSARVDDIGTQLAGLVTRVDTIGAAVIDALADSNTQDLRYQMNLVLDYPSTHGYQPLTYDRYETAENVFFTYGQDGGAATNAAFTAKRSDADPATTLNTFGADGSIWYLSQLARTYDPAFPSANGYLANPDIWSLAARSYATAEVQNPGFAKTVAASRPAGITLAGNRILDAQRAFSAPSADPAHRTNALFAGLVAGYRGAVANLSAGLNGLRADAVTQTGFDPWAGPAQPVTATTRPADITAKMGGCAQGLPLLTPPAKAQSGTLPNAAQLAVGLPRAAGAFKPVLRDCYDAAFTNPQAVVRAKQTLDLADVNIVVHQQIQLTAGGPWTDVRTVTGNIPGVTVCSTPWSPRGDPDSTCWELQDFLTDSWYMASFQSNGVASVVTGNLPAVEAVTGAQLAVEYDAMRKLWEKVAYALQPGQSLESAVAALNKADRLLSAYTMLGFPTGMAGDDLLHSLLRGPYGLIDDRPGETTLTDTYAVARMRFTPCPAGQTTGCTPAGPNLYQPLAAQPHLDGCATANGPGLPGDPVGNCLVNTANARIQAFADRIEQHSRWLVDGTESAALPIVTSTLAALDAGDRMARR